MSQTNYIINIEGLSEIDKFVLTQAIEAHHSYLSFSRDNMDADITITAEDMNSSAIRIGSILDMIEKKLYRTDYTAPLIFKNYTLEWNASTLTIDKESFQLSERERDVFVELITAGDKGCSKSYLLNKVWGYRDDLETHALETHIYRLRQKIEIQPDSPNRLLTIEAGYILS